MLHAITKNIASTFEMKLDPLAFRRLKAVIANKAVFCWVSIFKLKFPLVERRWLCVYRAIEIHQTFTV